MNVQPTLRNYGTPLLTIPTEERLLELFAPDSLKSRRDTPAPEGRYARLWREDAIHRAKNMAQLTVSLANVADHPSRRWLPLEVTAQARALARIYEMLGNDGGSQDPVPCAAMLTEVTTRLCDIFGRVRQVGVAIITEPISTTPEVRRGLILIASELVINALKYGYPGNLGGTISISLSTSATNLILVVEDDGIGLVDMYLAGHGSGLLDELCAVLNAIITRSCGPAGHGFSVLVQMPLGSSRVSDGANWAPIIEPKPAAKTEDLRFLTDKP